MTPTNEISTSEGIAALTGEVLKTDVLGRVTVGRAQREAILDRFETSGMTGSTFAQLHGIKIQTFASWIQKRRRARGDYPNEAMCRKLRMRKDLLRKGPQRRQFFRTLYLQPVVVVRDSWIKRVKQDACRD